MKTIKPVAHQTPGGTCVPLFYFFNIFKIPNAKTPPINAVKNCGQLIICATAGASFWFNNNFITMPEVRKRNKNFKPAARSRPKK